MPSTPGPTPRVSLDSTCEISSSRSISHPPPAPPLSSRVADPRRPSQPRQALFSSPPAPRVRGPLQREGRSRLPLRLGQVLSVLFRTARSRSRPGRCRRCRRLRPPLSGEGCLSLGGETVNAKSRGRVVFFGLRGFCRRIAHLVRGYREKEPEIGSASVVRGGHPRTQIGASRACIGSRNVVCGGFGVCSRRWAGGCNAHARDPRDP